MFDQEDVGYSLARNSRHRVHISHGDARACPALCLALRIEGFAVSTSINVEDLMLVMGQETFDAVVIGPLEEGKDDLKLISQIRAVQRGTRVISMRALT